LAAANGAGRCITVDYDVVMAAKSAPVSVRISKGLEALVDQEARRTGRSRSAVLEALASEALRMRLFPGIAFRGADWERRAWVIGTALDVWQIIEAYRDIGSVERMAAGAAAGERQIRLALAYCERFPDEIDAAIDADRRPLEQLRDEHPFIAVSGAGA
jgi:Ribbon-helix-helix protein, copG family